MSINEKEINELRRLAKEAVDAATALDRAFGDFWHSGVSNCWNYKDTSVDSLTLRNIRFAVRTCEKVADDARSAMGLMG